MLCWCAESYVERPNGTAKIRVAHETTDPLANQEIVNNCSEHVLRAQTNELLHVEFTILRIHTQIYLGRVCARRRMAERQGRAERHTPWGRRLRTVDLIFASGYRRWKIIRSSKLKIVDQCFFRKHNSSKMDDSSQKAPIFEKYFYLRRILIS